MQTPATPATAICKYCQSPNLILVTEGIPPPHYGKTICSDCGKFQTWERKPDQDKAKRPANHLNLVHKLGLDYCELCLRKEYQLPRPEILVAHHIIEYSDGGTDDPLNILIVCSSCHALIHHVRTYIGHYHA